MKKLLSMMCMAAMLLTLTACSTKSAPEDVVSTFCNAAKSYDFKTMRHCMNDSDIYLPNVEELKSINDIVRQVLEFMQEQAETIAFEITDVEIDGEQATLHVDFTYTDCAPVFLETMENCLRQGIALGKNSLEQEEAFALFETIFCEAATSAVLETMTVTTEFLCIKTGNAWNIAEVPPELLDVMTGNGVFALKEFAAGIKPFVH